MSIMNNTEAGLATRSLTWVEPTAEDNSGYVESKSDYNPGFDFPIGRTLVTYNFSDDSNNFVECLFNVTVLGNAHI